MMHPENPAQWMRENGLKFQKGIAPGNASSQAVNVKRNFSKTYKLKDLDFLEDLIGTTERSEQGYKKAIDFINNLARKGIKVTTRDLAAKFNFYGLGDGETAKQIVLAQSGKSRSGNPARTARNLTFSHPTKILSRAILTEVQPTKHPDGHKKVEGSPTVNTFRFVIPIKFRGNPQVLVITSEGFNDNILDKLNDVALYEVYNKKVPSSEANAGLSKDDTSFGYSLAELLHNVKDLNGNPYVVDGKLKFEDEMVMDVTNNVYEQLGEIVESLKADVREQYEGTYQWTKAPNGETTNLAEDQWLAVRTPAFKEWFGETVSIVVLDLLL